jgi:uncharacterized membrane protein YecN with MAPEG domain
LQIILLAEVIADLDDHRDAFGITGFGDGRLVGRGAKFPGIPGAKHRDDDSVGAVEVNFQLLLCHRNELRFGLRRLAHVGGSYGTGDQRQVAALTLLCRDPGDGAKASEAHAKSAAECEHLAVRSCALFDFQHLRPTAAAGLARRRQKFCHPLTIDTADHWYLTVPSHVGPADVLVPKVWGELPMSFTPPIVTAFTAGLIIVMQMALAFSIVRTRRRARQSIGDGGNQQLLLAIRRHGNFAENAAIFIARSTLLEIMSGGGTGLMILCAGFVLGRIGHLIGLSMKRPSMPIASAVSS